MNKLIKVMTTNFLLLGSISVYAGQGGNGGGSIVCTNGEGDITRAILLDLREAELDGLTINRQNIETEEIQLENALLKYAEIYPNTVAKMRKEITIINTPGVTVLRDKRLAPPTDTGIWELEEKRNCSLEGVASYIDKDKEKEKNGEERQETLKIDKGIYQNIHFTNTDRAALTFHEALYRVGRLEDWQIKNSKQIRKITGRIFAIEELTITSAKDGLDKALSRCEMSDKSAEFYVVSIEDNKYGLQFTRLAGNDLPEKTVLKIGKNYSGKYNNNQGNNDRGLRIIGKNSDANGLSPWVSEKLSKNEMKEVLRNTVFNYYSNGAGIFDSRFAYMTTNSPSMHGLGHTIYVKNYDYISTASKGDDIRNPSYPLLRKKSRPRIYRNYKVIMNINPLKGSPSVAGKATEVVCERLF